MSNFICDPRPIDPPEYWDEHFLDEDGEEQVFTRQEKFRVFYMEDDSDF
jgi:hypothetical protein